MTVCMHSGLDKTMNKEQLSRELEECRDGASNLGEDILVDDDTN